RPVSPGLEQLPSWRPDPQAQPCRVDATLLPFLTGQDGGPQLGAYGGVLTHQTTDQQPADATPPPHPREAESEGEHSDWPEHPQPGGGSGYLCGPVALPVECAAG